MKYSLLPSYTPMFPLVLHPSCLLSCSPSPISDSDSDSDSDHEDHPPLGIPKPKELKGYQQVYLIKNPAPHSTDTYSGDREVLFRCGNWCYVGRVTLDFGGGGGDSDSEDEGRMRLKDVPRVIPLLQVGNELREFMGRGKGQSRKGPTKRA